MLEIYCSTPLKNQITACLWKPFLNVAARVVVNGLLNEIEEAGIIKQSLCTVHYHELHAAMCKDVTTPMHILALFV